MLFRRISISLLSALFIMGVFATTFHKTTETHVVCAEHNHIVHSDHELDEKLALPSATLFSDESEHEACGPDYNLEKKALALSHFTFLAPRLEQPKRSKAYPHTFVWIKSALQDAPKTSPPSRLI